jgi:murein DD-endopeptidase MepM/ murein hydrolase activator NlpD
MALLPANRWVPIRWAIGAVVGGVLVVTPPVAAWAAAPPVLTGRTAASTAATAPQATSRVLVLRRGSHGAEVRGLQRRLHVTPRSGRFGAKTVSAVRAFQRVHHLRVTGVVEITTWRLLVHFTSVAPTLRRGQSGPWVKTLQKQLKVTPRSGFFGSLTQAAVLAYEKQHGLPANGVVGGRIWALLGHGGTIPTVRPAASRSAVRGRTCPVPGSTFTDTYGAKRAGHTHKGVDMFKKEGADILAIETGTVVRAHWSGSSGGWTITLKGTSGAKFFYAHNEKNLVKGGQHVTVGDTIALMGDTGNAKGNPQLHFEYWPSGREGAAVNPTPLVRSLC